MFNTLRHACLLTPRLRAGKQGGRGNSEIKTAERIGQRSSLQEYKSLSLLFFFLRSTLSVSLAFSPHDHFSKDDGKGLS